MGATLNLHRLFSTDDGYLKELRVADRDREVLSSAREEIRGALRVAFREWKKYVTRAELFEQMLEKASIDPDLPAPKFRIQGSFAYHTVNDCQQTPPQQVDQDDGMFLPIGFISNGGGTRPQIASKAYFKIVEDALKPLCASRGWTLNPGGQKDTCVRVGINSRLHIDLPLYAVEDEAFKQLMETRAASLHKSIAAMDAASADFSEEVYFYLADSEIALAHRKDGWIGSDPRKLEQWFVTSVTVYGTIVRRVCRAFKGLRDAHWADSDLGSICLMAATVTAFGRVGRLETNRDDLAILTVGRKMVEVLAGPIENPAFPGQPELHLCNGWEPGFRDEVRGVFSEALDKLERAIFHTLHRGIAVKLAREAFGDRVPADENLVALVGVAAVIRQVVPAPQPKPMVPRTTSG